MAKLNVAYGLCPLIDGNSLLGVSVDAVPDCVIVTVGKNIVTRYKFQDQKQVSSWSSKDKLTSPVVYNLSTQQYIAIFNFDQLRMWNEDDQLDKVKKYKFQEHLHCIVPDADGNNAYILYRSGCVTTLSEALDSRKNTKNKLNSPYSVKEQYLISCNDLKFVAVITSNEKDEKSLLVVPVLSGIPSAEYSMLWNKNENNPTLMGYTVMSKGNSCFLFSFWSDGSLFSYKFLPSVDNNFPGTYIQNISSFSAKHPVAITPISNRHLALFGADSSEEGASLLLLNLEFQLIQSRLHFKLYTKPPRLWNVSSHLLVAVGNSLIAVPYHLEVEKLSKLLGTHSTSVSTVEKTWTYSNIKKLHPIDQDAPKDLGIKIKLLRQEGCSQAKIVQNILPFILKENDINGLFWCLNTFSDIPENCVVQILNSCFSEAEPLFDTKSGKSHGENSIFNQKGHTTSLPLRFKESKEQITLIDKLLNVSFSDVCIMPYLRGVPLTTHLGLLNHLSELMERDSSVSSVRIIEWLCLLLDSHYQEYLLCHNEQILLLLTKLSKEVCFQIECLEEMKKLTPFLCKLQRGKIPVKLSYSEDRKYSIETLQLY